MNEHEVVIVGAGPTGLMLASELALAGVDVVVVERRETQALVGTRAGGLHSRTIELLDQRGIAERFLSEGTVAQVAAFAWVRLDIGDLPTRHPYGLALWQNHIERILAERVRELEVPIRYGREVTRVEQDEGGVEIGLRDGASLRASYLVGCDGGRSGVRKAAGIDFAGWEPTVSSLIAEVEMSEEPPWGMRQDALGIHGLSRLEGGPIRVVVTERRVALGGEPTMQELSAALVEVYGTDFGVHDPTWLSRFTDAARQATSYRAGRVLLAGDAAHVHSPVGGQGLNTGVQDAVNVGWKLAQVVRGTSPDGLLDSYHAGRHPVAARVVRNTLAQVALFRRPDDRANALAEVLADLLGMDEPRKRYGAMQSGLDVRYDLGEGHPLLGRRVPDLDLATGDGSTTRVFALLHDARPVLLGFGGLDGLDVTPWAERVRAIAAERAGGWELPVLGTVPPPAAVLIRPDGYVAWVGDGTDAGLHDALTRWFGPPAC